MKRILLLIVLLSTNILVFAQQLEAPASRQKDLADQLFSSGNYFDAVTEYERLLFFDSTEVYECSALCRIGLSYRAGGKFEEAEAYFNKAIRAAGSRSVADSIRLELIKTTILHHDYGTAFNVIKQYEASSSRTSVANYWRGWATMFMDDWEKAADYFSKADSAVFLQQFCRDVAQKKYSRNLAELFSAILPGAGQFYTGHYTQSAVSFGWNALWGYLMVKAFVADRVFDGVATGSLLWARFYSGGFQAAGSLADEKNKEIYTESLLFLEREYKGIKP